VDVSRAIETSFEGRIVGVSREPGHAGTGTGTFPQQTRLLPIGAGESVFDTRGGVVQKQRDDVFRHWILGFGAGDRTIRTSGTNQRTFDGPNVFRVASKLKAISPAVQELQVRNTLRRAAPKSRQPAPHSWTTPVVGFMYGTGHTLLDERAGESGHSSVCLSETGPTQAVLLATLVSCILRISFQVIGV
jgi:hypothetical protein